ncbi:MAG TPA: hypothetical protein ENI96_09900 [Sedimenticola thiotaurini]|uniref:Uncharacterized protein n=1 Tax=Sedimenticola thiotaurini TaxID=1543721 RepID=A0A831WB03_9GAMM|nr:hypothetical protein [Sedimenticola thiotaurini]
MTGEGRGFVPGDIVLHQGEAYQVHENLGDRGRVAPFPAVDVELMELVWDGDCRRIGHEPLPAPTPCAGGGLCPGEAGESAPPVVTLEKPD